MTATQGYEVILRTLQPGNERAGDLDDTDRRQLIEHGIEVVTA